MSCCSDLLAVHEDGYDAANYKYCFGLRKLRSSRHSLIAKRDEKKKKKATDKDHY